MYGDNTIRESTARKWFSRFKEDHFDISETPHSGRLSEFDEDRLNTLIHNDPRQYTRELANRTKFAFNGQGSKISCMGTHPVSQNHRNQQVTIGASLLARYQLARE